MNRTQIYLTDHEQHFLEKEAELLGVSKSELIRRILDLYISMDNKLGPALRPVGSETIPIAS